MRQWRDGAPAGEAEDVLAAEEPLEIRLNGEALSVTMRTPGQDEDLVGGFLWTEQILDEPADLLGLATVSPNVVDARVAPRVLEGKCWLRNFYASSSCGVCGKASIEQLRISRPIVASPLRVAAELLWSLPERMRARQEVFERTGGLHAAALFDAAGELLCLREDVGRHNAVDKVVGWALAEGRLPLGEAILLVSGRTSFEILQKAIAAGIPLLAAVSAPSSLAVRLAEDFGVTLVGFLRGRNMNVYAHGGRIQGG